MNKQVCQFPAIFYIVHMDHLDMIRCWVKYGGDPNATSGLQRLPLLAFAILYTRDTRTIQQATSTVETLLMLGASPFVIPRAFYMPFNGRLLVDGSIQGEIDRHHGGEAGLVHTANAQNARPSFEYNPTVSLVASE
ncbi:hypothetical protein F4823DRAFT_618992 [Ustulina deusta]|nr:hypothetical protein F4823DRAFT_618992 [Ustulina deusta]